MIAVTPLDAWIREKIGIGREPKGALLLKALEEYQLRKLNETIDYSRRNAPFYRRRLASMPSEPLSALSDLARIPFATAADLSADPFSFLAVPQDDIARIVTLRTSGSTGEAKRLFFTEGDLELTVDFFHRGMATMVRAGQKAAILLPCETPDSVGDLLARGLQRLGVASLRYGAIADPAEAGSAIASFGAHCLIGIPTQVLAAALSDKGRGIGKGRIESVLLSTDYVPRAISKTLAEVWGCRVFTHYGATEMGLGGGVECEALDGYHLREADLYFEIVDRQTGEPLPDGATGEAVFTTLTRRGMPLIRCRTGDIARIIPEPCPCGSSLRRMAQVAGRWDDAIRLGSDAVLTLPKMDEALFSLPGLLDYRATVSKGTSGKLSLRVEAHRAALSGPTEQEALDALNDIDAIQRGMAESTIETPTIGFSMEGRWSTTGAAKRKIVLK